MPPRHRFRVVVDAPLTAPSRRVGTRLDGLDRKASRALAVWGVAGSLGSGGTAFSSAWLMNAIVHASLYRYNRAERRAFFKPWRGSIAIDGTKLPISTTRFGGGVRKEDRGCNSTELHHPEAVAGWHVRLGDHGGFHEDGITALSDKELRDAAWALEVHFAVSVDDEDANKAHPVLNLAIGISIDTPGASISGNSLTTLEAAHKVTVDHGIAPGTVVGDRAVMPNAQYRKLKAAARRLGFKTCHDYTRTQLGKQQGPICTVHVEGIFRCPAMPAPMVNATKKFRNRQDAATTPIAPEDADDAAAAQPDRTYTQQLERSHVFDLPVKELPNADGELRVSCPASDPRGGVSCPLREAIVAKIEDDAQRTKLQTIMKDKTKTRVRIPNPPVKPGIICTSHQASHTITLDDKTGKYYQDYTYKSPKWYKMYGQRNQVETFNKDVKDNGMRDTKRRRFRGFAKQGITAAIFAAATNVKRINAFLAIHRANIQVGPRDPGPTGRPRRGHSTSILSEDLPPPDVIAA